MIGAQLLAMSCATLDGSALGAVLDKLRDDLARANTLPNVSVVLQAIALVCCRVNDARLATATRDDVQRALIDAIGVAARFFATTRANVTSRAAFYFVLGVCARCALLPMGDAPGATSAAAADDNDEDEDVDDKVGDTGASSMAVDAADASHLMTSMNGLASVFLKALRDSERAVVESAVLALGDLCLGLASAADDGHEALRQRVLDGLMWLKKHRHEEVSLGLFVHTNARFVFRKFPFGVC